MAENTTGASAHKAGLFDIRMIIGSLLAAYGLIVLLTGIFGSDDKVKDAGTINTWVGVGMLVAGGVFIAWTRLRPIVVPEDVQAEERPAAH